MKRILLVAVFLVAFANFSFAQTCNVPTVDTTQYICELGVETLGDLAVDGFYSRDLPDVFWYDSDDDVNDLIPLEKTTLLTPRIYYVSRTCANGIISSRVAITVEEGVLENSVFEYDVSEACIGGGTSFMTPNNNIGTFTQSRVSAGSGALGMNSNTGFIFVNSSASGIYDVTHTVNTGALGTCPSSTTQRVTITTGSGILDPAFDYSPATVCGVDGGFATPVISGDSGGIFSSTPGLEIDSATGIIDIANSIPNDDLPYQVTYTLSYGCAGEEVSHIVSFRVVAYKEADFTYGANTFCKSDGNPIPTVASGARGTYSATSGLVFVDFFPGVIDLDNTPAGEYTVTYTTRVTDICNESFHSEVITIVDNPSTSFSYNAFYCEGDLDPVPQGTFGGGVFTASPPGLNIAANSGIINLAGSTAGTYTIIYTLSGTGGCTVGPSSQTITIKVALPITDAVQEFCEVAGVAPTLQDLYAFGPHEERWYDSLSSTTPLDPNVDPELTSQTYYVSSYSAQCNSESSRVPVEVFVYGSSYALTVSTNIDAAGFVPSTNNIITNYDQSLALQIPQNFSGTVSWSGPNSFTATGKTITVSNALSILHQGTYTATVTFPMCSETTSLAINLTVNGAPEVLVAPKVYLQGAMLDTTEASLMRDDLRSQGYLPTTSPYADGLTVLSTRFDVQPNPADNIVDWIWVELRDAIDPTVVVSGQSALLQRDGDILSVLGDDDLTFDFPSGDYYVAIKHRNHLSIMSNSTISLSGTSEIINFNDGTVPTYGMDAQTHIGMPSGAYGMWAGDANGDGKLLYTSGASDRFTVYSDILSAVGNTGFDSRYNGYNGYLDSDVNMNGNSLYVSSGGDRFVLYVNVISHPENVLFSTNYVLIEEKLPI